MNGARANLERTPVTMARSHGGVSIAESGSPDAGPIRRTPPAWSLVLAIYAGSRLLTTGILALVYWLAATFGWSFADSVTRPDLIGLMGSWDARFYRQIALFGYPAQLPLDAHGDVAQNAWAFLPIYPWLTRVLMNATGMDFATAGVLLSVAFSAGAAVLLQRILVPRIGRTASLWSVAFFCVGPMSFILQAAYADGLFLFLMFASLLAMQARRYLLMIPFGVVAAFTHPGALPLAAALGILLIVSVLRREHQSWAERIRMLAAAAIITAASLAWPVIASATTAYSGAYFDTELAWWTGYVGHTHFFPFTPWFIMAGTYLGVPGIVLVVVIVGLFVLWLLHRSTRVLGDEILAFAGSYGAYLFAVFLPQQSLVRVLLPLSPILGTPALTRSPAIRRITLGVFIASQVVAIVFLWFLGPP
jgi:hypothetical protein